jgi:hypothetical protein
LAEDRESAVLRKADLLLGPTPTDAALQAEAQAAAGTAAAAAIAAAEDARNSNVMMTSSGRRVKVGCWWAQPGWMGVVCLFGWFQCLPCTRVGLLC